MKPIQLILILILLSSPISFAQYATIDWKMHSAGQVRQFITNVGKLDDSGNIPYTSYGGWLWCEMPPGSNEEHLSQGGIWIGAITPEGDTLVSVTRTHFTSEEFFPTTESWDTIWVVGKNQTLNIPFWPNYIGNSDQDFVCRYSDYNILNIQNHVPLYIDVLQRSCSWNAGPKSECIILKYDIIPTQFNLSQVFFGFWLHSEIGNDSIGTNWSDELIYIYPDLHMVIAEDAPGGDDGTAFSPIGIKILEPRDSTLIWTMKYYDHEQLANFGRDEVIYREMSSGDIYPSRLDPERAHIAIAFGPFQALTVSDTLHVEIAEIFGEGLKGTLDNAAYWDSLYFGIKPESIHPLVFEVKQNYPNPFNPVTTINFNLLKTSQVTLTIYNILGQNVATLVSDRLSAGSYSYQWDAGNLASGVHIYTLYVESIMGETKEFVETKKMVLLR